MLKKRILVIDDEEVIGQMVKLNLEETGEYTVETLTSGLNAVNVAKAFKPDFVLLDVVMPDIDGPAVYNNLKENKETKDIPVVFLTAIVTDQDVAENGNIVGGHPMMAKPVTTRKLIECIKKYSK